MKKTIDIYSDEEEESIPEWAIELQKQYHEDMEQFQNEINKISIELNEIDVGIKTANELLKSSNALMASSNALMDSSNALMASSNARIESATFKKNLALKEMKEIQEKIFETEVHREEIDKYWNDLISEEIEKRNTCRHSRCPKESTKKSFAKRLNNTDHHKHLQTKKKKTKITKTKF